MKPDYPLWMPKGSVRALIAFTVIGIWAALELITAGNAPNEVRALAGATAAAYGLMRAKAPEA